MKVQDVMSKSVRSISVTEPIRRAAQVMGEAGVGSLPVLQDWKVVGIVTDRDIAVRAVGGDLKPNEPVELVMTGDVRTCHPDTHVADVLEVMGEQQIRRMPVCDEQGHLTGIVTISDLVRNDPDQQKVAETLSKICRPSELHSQHTVVAGR